MRNVQAACDTDLPHTERAEHLHSIGRPLFVFDDGSEAARALLADGASPIGLPETLFAQPEPQLRLDL